MSLTAAGATALAGGLAAAATLGSTAASAGMSKAARRENYMYNEWSAQNAFERQKEYQKFMTGLQYDMFYDLESPKAKMEQLKAAGLSPSIFAEGSLGGNISGVTTGGAAPQGAGASGLPTQVFPFNPMDIADTTLKMATAKKEEAEANRIEGNNARGMAEVAELYAKKGLDEAATQLKKAEADYQELIALTKKETFQADIDYAYHLLDKIQWDTELARVSAMRKGQEIELTEEQWSELVQEAANRNAEILSNIALNNSNISLNSEKAIQMQNEIAVMWEDLFNKVEQININTTNTELREKELNEKIREFDNNLELLYKKYELDVDNLIMRFADKTVVKNIQKGNYLLQFEHGSEVSGIGGPAKRRLKTITNERDKK